MISIKSINTIHNDFTLVHKDESYVIFSPKEQSKGWSVNIDYATVKDDLIEGNLTFTNPDDSDETLQFKFDNTSSVQHDNKEDSFVLNVDGEHKIKIELPIDYDKDGNAIVGDTRMNTDMAKITDNTNFIDYEHLVIQFPDSHDVHQLMMDCDDCESVSSFRTDYYDNFNPWIA